jgi:WD40 repeat protein
MLPASLLMLALIPLPRLDADGIPLPAEALRRFGSLRWYADPPRSVAFSPDGKVAYLVPADLDRFDQADRPPAVTAWAMPSGRPLWQFTDHPLTGLMVAVDPDGKSVWLAGRLGRGDQREWHKQPFVRVKLDAATGNELAREVLLPGWSQAVDLRADGTLAWNRFEVTSATEGDLSLRILKPDGTEGATWEPDGSQGIDVVKFSPDGKTLFVSGPKEAKFKSRLAAVDPTTGKTRWAVDCPQVDSVAVSPDGKTLAAVTASTKLPTPPAERNKGWPEEDATYLARFAAATGETDISVQIGKFRRKSFREHRPYLGRPIRFTADGKSLLVLSDDQRKLPIDPDDWVKEKEEDDPSAFAWFTPDGKSYLPGHNRSQPMRVYDAATREPIADQPDALLRATWAGGYGVSFPADGKRVRFGNRGDVVEWDTASGKEVARVPWQKRKGEPQTGVARLSLGYADVSLLSPDGKLLFRQYNLDPRSERKMPELLDAKSGEPAAVKVELRDDLDRIAFTPDSKKLIGMESGGDVYLWDLTTGGKPLLEPRLNKAGGGGVNSLMCVTETHAVVAEPNWGFDYYDPAQRWSFSRFPFDGFKREKTWRGQGTIEDLATTPGGGFVGWAEVWHGKGKPPTKSLFVIDPGADAPREYPLPAGTGFAVSPDGRTAAFGVGSGGIALYELATGKVRHTFRGLRRPAVALAFSPDGKALASESADGPVVLWDVKGVLSKPATPDAGGWDAAWAYLSGDDAEKAFDAIRLFARFADGVGELKARLAEQRSPSIPLAERAVEAVQLADTEEAKRVIGEWASGDAKSPLTAAAKRK